MTFGEKINRFSKKLDPVLRVPFVFAIDWLINSLDFGDFSSVKAIPALLLLFSLLFIASHGNLIFIQGFMITFDIFITLAFFTIGKHSPTFQQFIFTVDKKSIITGALIFYQGLIFTIGIDNLYRSLNTLFFFAIWVVFTAILCRMNYSFTLGFWYFMLSEFFGIHKQFQKSLQEASLLANSIGYMNTFIFYYRTRRISLVLRLFWLLTIVTNFSFEANAKYNLSWFLVCTGATLNTHLRLFALALWLPEISYMLLWISRALLSWSLSHTARDLEPRDMGKALVFYFIATFNSVLDVKIIQRVFFVALMLFISFSYILQSVYKLCDETLKTISTSLQHNYWVHIRAITLTLSLVFVLLYTSWMFCSLFSFRVWQLVVVSSNVVTAVQALGSLAVYALFVYDLKSLNKLEQLDDWVYYLNAVSKSLEFLSAFLVLSFGVWDVIQGSWSIFGLVVIVIHTYYNVWLTATNGWKVFLSRRTAVTKLNRLSDATEDQLAGLQDVCAICFDSMSSAKVTQCGHYFHSNCLRKWLYIQSSCPLCHQDVLVNDKEED
ncbi:RING finger protein 145-like [Dendronephthya gigantea]|uniref:RING finger protein 145-like n=1 Tax=Dendronephthya gigantea TaxID=151771 RepID=UPI00106B93B9|nr:RING finger protein 145-like [Dendronephthya gigantea]